MELKTIFVTLSIVLSSLAVNSAYAQSIDPIAQRDRNWEIISHVGMGVSATSVFFTPRVYFSDPESTVGWKGRWHFSMFAPAATMTALTFVVDGPIRRAMESTRPGCTYDQTLASLPESNCESFGGPSTHAFASWGATGVGIGIFAVDTFKYSKGKFSGGSFIGNVLIPFSASLATSIGRTVEPGNSQAFENTQQVAIGAAAGLVTGAVVGASYAIFQRPNCGYGDALFCW